MAMLRLGVVHLTKDPPPACARGALVCYSMHPASCYSGPPGRSHGLGGGVQSSGQRWGLR